MEPRNGHDDAYHPKWWFFRGGGEIWGIEQNIVFSDGFYLLRARFSHQSDESFGLHLELLRTLGIMIPVTIVPLVEIYRIARPPVEIILSRGCWRA
jgi:hypothetical protein